MGSFREGVVGHEGFPVAYVEVEPGSRAYRELGYPADHVDRADVAMFGAGCECGWRSPRLELGSERRDWVPYIVLLNEDDEARWHALWEAHVDGFAPQSDCELCRDTGSVRAEDPQGFPYGAACPRGCPVDRG